MLPFRIQRGNAKTATCCNLIVSFAFLIAIMPHGRAQQVDQLAVEPTPALQIPQDRELTTVLVVNNNPDEYRGRHSVRPEVGLLTSTARTFIQEGVTTEYATQVVGTRLDNGRVYAQYLKKSSRVLYENGGERFTPSVVTSWVGSESTNLPQSHNDLSNADQPDWQDIEDRLRKVTFVGNTDFVGNEWKRGKESLKDTTKLSSSTTESTIDSKLTSVFPLNQALNRNGHLEDLSARQVAAFKVLPIADLPTYTVKNFYAPSGFASDSLQGRSAKQIYQNVFAQKPQEEATKRLSPPALVPEILPRRHHLATTTYYGFADFTTIVGDSVIVFSPSSSSPNINLGQVTSIKGEATLDSNSLVKPTRIVEVPTTTTTLFGNQDERNHMNIHIESQSSSQLPPPPPPPLSSSPLSPPTPSLTLTEINRNTILESSERVEVELTASSTQHIEAPLITPSLSKPTDEEVSSIFAALAKQGVEQQATSSAKSTNTIFTSSNDSGDLKQSSDNVLPPTTDAPSSQIPSDIASSVSFLGGATTIFFEDDPFTNFIEPLVPTSTSQENDLSSSDLAATAISSANNNLSDPDNNINEIRSSDVKLADSTPSHRLEINSIISTKIELAPSSVNPEVTTTGGLVIKELNDEYDHTLDEVLSCSRTSQVFLTQLPKTVTYFTTYLTTTKGQGDVVESSIETNVLNTFDIVETTKKYCIQPTATIAITSINELQATATTQATELKSDKEVNEDKKSKDQIEHADFGESTTISSKDSVETESPDTETMPETTTSNSLIDEETTEFGSDDDSTLAGEIDETDDSEEDDEVELVYKTLYTTYTYLTTFFQESTSSILSHTEVVTNILTSTVGSYAEALNSQMPAIPALDPSKVESNPSVEPTSALQSRSNQKLQIKALNEIDNFIKAGEESLEEHFSSEDSLKEHSAVATEPLNQSLITKTFETTYTYFTTIFAEGETEIISRTEVLTNIITATATNAATANVIETSITKAIEEDSTTSSPELEERSLQIPLHLNYKTMSRVHQSQTGGGDATASIVNSSLSRPLEYDSLITLKTDVRSSSSNGETHLLNSTDNGNLTSQLHNQFDSKQPMDDQISSESNTEEIIPSATLLLQTSFTTFTYFTTMYNGESTNVVSHLETITNVVTETLQATKTYNEIATEDVAATLPITYFTTFTYWTKLAKDGIISTLSREETISNVVTPTQVYSKDSMQTTTLGDVLSSTSAPSLHTSILEPTTFYTTYTYYTTSYEADETITNSRFETITNVITPTTTIASENAVTKIIDTAAPSTLPPPTESLLLLDYKTIIDADGISTLYFMTQVTPSVDSNGVVVEATSSTSSLYIDEIRKALSPTISTPLSSTIDASGNLAPVRLYKTGLVRLIEGTRIGNHTTTLYQSKVIGTLIDNRYAQIIESTSSFLIEKETTTPSHIQASSDLNIAPTKSEDSLLLRTSQLHLDSIQTSSLSVNAIQSSIQESDDLSPTEKTASDDDENANDEDGDDSNRARLPFQSKKRTFTPVIRPFASRNRPQFAPKKKSGISSSATIITRSDFTPTITATPALKSSVGGVGGRFSSSRRGAGGASSGLINSSSKRFGRPSSSRNLSSQQQPSSTSSSPSASSFGRNRFASTSRAPLLGGGSSRRPLQSLQRSSSIRTGGSSSLSSNLNRFRIKPTAAFGAFGQQSSSKSNDFETTTPHTASDENEDESSTVTSNEEDDNENNEALIENQRRQQNPLLRFRRPLPATGAGQQRTLSNSNNLVSPRRNPLTNRLKSATTTTSTTTTTTSRPKGRSFQRPPGLLNLPAGGSRSQRPQSNLFPPRGLFQTQPKQGDTSPANSPGKKATKNAEEETNDEDNEYEDDDEEEGDGDGDDENSARKRRASGKKRNEVASKPTIKSLKRLKRSADSASLTSRSNFRNKFRRPQQITTEDQLRSLDESTDNPKDSSSSTASSSSRVGRLNARFGSKYSNNQANSSPATTQLTQRPIRPTRPTSAGRAQFTLRGEKDTTTNKVQPRPATGSGSFRRPKTTTAAASRRAGTASLASSRRLKTYGSNNNANSDSSASRTSARSRGGLNLNRGRATPSRNRNRNDYNPEPVFNTFFDGTITVTHVIPAEVTIPVISGQLTEYKNIVTAKTSTEILGPHQYTSYLGENGLSTLALNREESMTNLAGATEVTQFILHESLTTTITFTPTTIRGRKTSFSHVLPSTVYSVENVVSTVQPQLANNAPLANILLSQLLLGNIGLPNANANPLLGPLSPQQLQTTPALPQTPVTEFRTHTSTYVTTIFEGMSTIVPVTFQGKKILTTVYDTTAQTITATEFITDTIVSTPTQQPTQAAQQQVNSLLLQQLLQQAQQLPQLPLKQAFTLPVDSNLQDLADTSNIQQQISNDGLMDYRAIEEEQTKATKSSNRKKSRKSGKSGGHSNRRSKPQDPQPPESSVITLYVSGRRPGEFSTILSTVPVNNNNYNDAPPTVHKREASDNIALNTLGVDNPDDFYEAEGSDNYNAYISLVNAFEFNLLDPSQYDNTPAVTNFVESSTSANNGQTQSLESLVGDVSLWYGGKSSSNSIEISNKKSTEISSQSINQSSPHFLL